MGCRPVGRQHRWRPLAPLCPPGGGYPGRRRRNLTAGVQPDPPLRDQICGTHVGSLWSQKLQYAEMSHVPSLPELFAVDKHSPETLVKSAAGAVHDLWVKSLTTS